MKFKNIILICLLIVIATIGAVNASDDIDDAVCIDNNDTCEISHDFSVSNQDVPLSGDDDEEEEYTEVIIDIPDVVEIGAGDSLVVQLPEDAKGKLDVYLNGNSWKSFTNLDGEEDSDFEVNLDNLSCGIYTISATFISSTAKYGTVSNSSIVNVTYNITIDIVEDPYIYGKDDNLVYVSAPSDILSEIEVKINNKTYILNKVSGSSSKGYINISSFAGGSYSIVASFAGNNKFKKYSTNDTIRIVSAIDALTDDLVYNSDAYVILRLPEDANGNLTLTVNGVLIGNVNVINNEAKIKFPTSTVGLLCFNATYTGTDFDIGNLLNRYVNVVPKVNIPSQMTVGENQLITFELNSDAGGTFVIEADYEPYATVNAGSSVSLANLEDGEIDINIVYYGSNNYIYYFDTFNVIVNPLPVRFIGVNNINMLYGDGTTYSVTIYGTNGKLLEEDEYVEFKIGKKSFDEFTNSKGTVNFKIPNSILPGKYTVTIIYDDEHSVTSTLVVKQNLVLKKVKVKSSAKKLVLKASLKKMNGKFLKGKSIDFKFNGKKFTAKTDKKGVAKVTIKENVLKKLKPDKKIKYQATYLKNTVKQVVKVSK